MNMFKKSFICQIINLFIPCGMRNAGQLNELMKDREIESDKR